MRRELDGHPPDAADRPAISTLVIEAGMLRSRDGANVRASKDLAREAEHERPDG